MSGENPPLNTAPHTGDTSGQEKEFSGRIAVITGASRGYGAALAKALGARGAKCVLIARTVGGLEETDDAIRTSGGEKALLVPHDLNDLDGLDRLGASLYERFGRVDIIAGCAAKLGPLTPLGHCPPQIWQKVQTVNATANYRLLRSLDPLFRRSDAGRALFATDPVAQQRPAYWAAYASSKAAMEALVMSYAAELERSNHRINLVSLPPMRTLLRAAAFPGESPTIPADPDPLAVVSLKHLSSEETVHGQIVKLSPSS